MGSDALPHAYAPAPALQEQRENWIWRELSQPEAKDFTIGIMGFGGFEQDSARKPKTLGFNVIGWTKSGRKVEGFETYCDAGLNVFLGITDFLVGLLPLTPDTRHIYNTDPFTRLRRKGPFGAPVFHQRRPRRQPSGRRYPRRPQRRYTTRRVHRRKPAGASAASKSVSVDG